MKKLILAAALAGTIVSGAAIAAQNAPAAQSAQKPGRMAQADTNADGTITRAEFLAQAGTRFDARDANRDGTIAGDELVGRNGQARPDAKPMSRAAAMERAATMFDRLDTSKDGKLDATERQAMRGRMGANRRGGPDGQHAMRGGHHGIRLAKVDANKDGRISQDEMRARADKRFARLDANKDGFIDKAEIATVRAKMKHRAPGAAAPRQSATNG
ncbi:hypothetical protein H5J25_07950 [Sphingomonas aliaeris]|uniref:EF-hand domain-containing protein n=1 Tax=Sphingomonas aliaeris TaxID=2759526 RepID=A0A974NX55_9SPHN|nr:hypothetical protein [Sphingomonas aliaeris]QQV78542.1 hypothetical protein H5J25_07950 [Sphingomonas aliaeris]